MLVFLGMARFVNSNSNLSGYMNIHLHSGFLGWERDPKSKLYERDLILPW